MMVVPGKEKWAAFIITSMLIIIQATSGALANNYFPVKCVFCHDFFMRKDLSIHEQYAWRELLNVYTVGATKVLTASSQVINRFVLYMFPVKCPNGCSSEKFKHEALEAHLNTFCPFQEIKCD